MSQKLIPDLLAPDLRIVFCGTALGTKSFQEKAYYAKPGNKFWPTLHEIGLTPRQFQPQEYRKLLALGIGLTDLSKTAHGNDADLTMSDFDIDATKEKIERYQPQVWAFTSKKAGAIFLGKSTSKIEYGLQDNPVGSTQLYILCSPSGLATRWWNKDIWLGIDRILRKADCLPAHPSRNQP